MGPCSQMIFIRSLLGIGFADPVYFIGKGNKCGKHSCHQAICSQAVVMQFLVGSLQHEGVRGVDYDVGFSSSLFERDFCYH